MNISATAFVAADTRGRFNMVFFGNDTITGGPNNDTLGGGVGADTFNGADGLDIVSFEFALSGVGADLTNNTQNFGEAFGDIYNSIEGFLGSDFNDVLIGNSGDNNISGGAGDDTITGSFGNDTLFGGTSAGDSGTDTIVFTGASNGLVVVLGAQGDGMTFNTNLGTDTFSGFENVIGSSQTDQITGNAAANRLEGREGSDTLNGGGGADTLVGGLGDDVYVLNDVAAIPEESDNAGIDEIQTTLDTYTLGFNFERLTFTGSGSFLGGGNNADNQLTGGSGDDQLFGMGGNDTLIGGAGINALNGGVGADVLDGSMGVNDTASYSDTGRAVRIVFSPGYTNQTTSGDAVGDTFIGIETFVLGAFADSFVYGSQGPAGIRNVFGGGGDDGFVTGLGLGNTAVNWYGEAGNDLLIFGNINGSWNIFDGGQGTDTASFLFTTAPGGITANMTATNAQGLFTVLTSGQDQGLINIENIQGSNFGDRITGNVFANALEGFGGADQLNGFEGDDTLLGGVGNDLLLGGLGADSLNGDGDNDTLWGFDGDDSLSGGTGNDSLYGEAGVDRIDGQDGADQLFGWLGNDILLAGEDNDTVYGEQDNDLIFGWFGADLMWGGDGNDTLWGEQDNDMLLGEVGDDSLFGVDGNDAMYGWIGNDSLYGWTGEDVLFGEQGSDSLLGEEGDDIIVGGLGNDTMIGGQGADRFFNANFEIAAGELDLIRDYDAADRYLFQTGAQIQYFNFNAPGYAGAGIHVQVAGGVFILDVLGATATQLQAQTLFF